MQVKGVTMATRQVTLQDTDHQRDVHLAPHSLLRRWDQQPHGHADHDGIPLRQAVQKWFELEDGVHIWFDTPEALHICGDFWLIPARTANRDVLWPQSPKGKAGQIAVPADGPPRYLAPLALLKESAGEPVDLRGSFQCVSDGPRDDTDPGHPTAGYPAVQRETLLADATTMVIRTPIVLNRVRSVSTVEPDTVFAVRDGTTIGRGPDAGISFDHPAISRHHAVFHVEDEALTITDLGSLNGTTVNGQRLAAREPATLAPNDTIELGSPDIQLRVEEPSPAGTTETGEDHG
jgi:hypothetical protein